AEPSPHRVRARRRRLPDRERLRLRRRRRARDDGGAPGDDRDERHRGAPGTDDALDPWQHAAAGIRPGTGAAVGDGGGPPLHRALRTGVHAGPAHREGRPRAPAAGPGEAARVRPQRAADLPGVARRAREGAAAAAPGAVDRRAHRRVRRAPAGPSAARGGPAERAAGRGPVDRAAAARGPGPGRGRGAVGGHPRVRVAATSV
ncbi:MAG: hypothetical protein AVDCRST_MAG79-316, partial [uncultured Thermoleophilia bacterium]